MSIKKSSTNKEKFDRPDIGKRIKFVRGDTTQSNFAKLLNTSQGTIAKYEKGMMPPADILDRISQHSGYSIRWLLSGLDDGVVKDQQPGYQAVQNVTSDERALLLHFRQCDRMHQLQVLEMVALYSKFDAQSPESERLRDIYKAVNSDLK